MAIDGAAASPLDSPLDTGASAAIAQRLAEVRGRVDEACQRSGRDRADVGLVAVSKTRSMAEIHTAMRAGQLDFGENRIQEALDKASSWPPGARVHFIGQLQTNKARDAARLFDLIHSVDSEKLLARLERLADRQLDVLIQVKLAPEERRGGIQPDELPRLLEIAGKLERVRVRGLMTLPPIDADARACFQRLSEIRESQGGAARYPHLSMGMSRDFEAAVEEGATLIRIGEAIFGPRQRPA